VRVPVFAYLEVELLPLFVSIFAGEKSGCA
jgi:hypothetical protein